MHVCVCMEEEKKFTKEDELNLSEENVVAESQKDKYAYDSSLGFVICLNLPATPQEFQVPGGPQHEAKTAS